MAELRSIFIDGVNTLFDTFEDAVKIGTYSAISDDGFDDPITVEHNPVRCIFENFTAKDLQVLSFGPLIQPKDIKGLVPYSDLSIDVSMKDIYTVDDGTVLPSGEVGVGVVYTVEGWELDPMSVIWTFLFRRT